jgi:hypothetical protein
LTTPHAVELKPYSPRRSNRANSFYWAAVVVALVQFFEEQGQMVSAEYAHDLLVRRNLGEREVMAPDGAVEKLRLETHTLSRDEFSAYVERCIAWLAEWSIEVPDRMQDCLTLAPAGRDGVPLIPLPMRPRRKLHNYFILWEANWNPEPPRDPYLLKPLAGTLMEIVAEWDLSPLEIAAVRGATA